MLLVNNVFWPYIPYLSTHKGETALQVASKITHKQAQVTAYVWDV